MCLDVCCKMALPGCPKTAHLTLVGFVIAVDIAFKMLPQRSRVNYLQKYCQNLNLKINLPMCDHVRLQECFVTALVITQMAGVGLLTCMGPEGLVKVNKFQIFLTFS